MSKRSPSQVTLADGSPGYIQPNGSIVSGISSICYEEPDGNGGTVTVDTGGPDRQRRHTEAVQRFAKSRQYRKAVRRLRAPACARPGTSQARQRGAGRPRAQTARSSARSGDSGDEDGLDEPAPGWRWAQSVWGRSA
jgi:hypothetical protein